MSSVVLITQTLAYDVALESSQRTGIHFLEQVVKAAQKGHIDSISCGLVHMK